jgi:hypothetical protein
MARRGRIKDITGQRFGRLEAVSFVGMTVGNRAGRSAIWRLRCDCGAETQSSLDLLRSGHVQSCGCLARELISALGRTHGRSHTPEYNTWRGMIERCTNANHKNWADYGGRGITVCDRWRHDDEVGTGFGRFLEDMGPRPHPRATLDRLDTNAGYSPARAR